MIHIEQKEMVKAFRNHKKLLEAPGNDSCLNTRMMVLFYAVECGLKALYMQNSKLKRTDQADYNGESIETVGHNLNRLLDKLKMKVQVPKSMTKDNIQFEHDDLHTAWRYGKKLDRQKEQKCIEVLKKILNQLKVRL